MAKYADTAAGAPNVNDIVTAEAYLRMFYIDPSEAHAKKYPSCILDRLPFMGDMLPMDFWKWLLEPQCSTELRYTKGRRIVWGYVDRIANCAAKFVALDQESQKYILKARKQEQPIWWRGDTMDDFRVIARESFKYNQMTETEQKEYRMSSLRSCFNASDAKAS